MRSCCRSRSRQPSACSSESIRRARRRSWIRSSPSDTNKRFHVREVESGAMTRRLLQLPAVSAALALAIVGSGVVSAQELPRSSDATGYAVDDDAVWSFYASNGGSATFGEPISHEFQLF